jgi:hypothetical protein
MFPPALARILILSLLVLCCSFSAGCGIVVDIVNHARALQFAPGALYDPAFYRTATPEKVKKEIDGCSLADASFVERRYVKKSPNWPIFPRALVVFIDFFWPASYVREDPPVYPLQTAAKHTPYPEVITVLLDAGARPETVDLPVGGRTPEVGREINKILLSRSQATVRNQVLAAFVRRGDREMVDYCLSLPDVDVNFDASGHYSPLRTALSVYGGEQNAMAVYLMERGAIIPKDADGELKLFSTTLLANNIKGFWMLVKLGADCSRPLSNGDSLMEYAHRVTDEAVLLHLAERIPVDGKQGANAVYSASERKSVPAVRRLLDRGALPVKNTNTIYLKDEPYAAELRTMLEKKGFPVHVWSR